MCPPGYYDNGFVTPAIDHGHMMTTYIHTFNATSSFMFLSQYSILNVFIARRVTLYSAQQLRNITKNIF